MTRDPSFITPVRGVLTIGLAVWLATVATQGAAQDTSESIEGLAAEATEADAQATALTEEEATESDGTAEQESPAEEPSTVDSTPEEEPSPATAEVPEDSEADAGASEEAEATEGDTQEGSSEPEQAEEASVGPGLGELIRRLPELGAVMHSAAVHMPIALWLFGAMFVVVGLVAPSWRNQIPLACLIGGAIFSVGAVLTGWWVADYEWGNDWREVDWDEVIVQHRWSAVGSMALSFVLSIIAIVSQFKQSPLLGFIWRLGLVLLALWIGWIGHLGGELMRGEGFFEEALELWLSGE